jgi:hypothetical protein
MPGDQLSRLQIGSTLNRSAAEDPLSRLMFFLTDSGRPAPLRCLAKSRRLIDCGSVRLL